MTVTRQNVEDITKSVLAEQARQRTASRATLISAVFVGLGFVALGFALAMALVSTGAIR